jgi:Domain of unknown function (DUF4349)
MRIVPFPSDRGTAAEQDWLAELEAALEGGAEGPNAESWRELRRDVRGLAPQMTPEFERALAERLAESHEHGGRFERLGARLGSLGAHRRPLVAGLGSAMAALIAVVLLVGSLHNGGSGVGRPSVPAGRSDLGTSGPEVKAAASPTSSGGASSAEAVPAPGGEGPTSPTFSSSPNRVQQRAASLTLGASSSEVQSIADGVARLVASVGGFVQSSHVQVQKEGSSGAELTVSIPTVKLDRALASLGELAPVRAESQSTQDITNSYEAASRRLSDANVERQALLRALSAASTQGQIDSLRERLAGVSRAIAQDHTSLQALSHRASNSEVEVTVAADRHASSKGLTLHSGLHDAGRVLLVTLTVLLIAAAVLVPLALLIAALLAGRGALRRYRRERVLDAS